MSTTITCDPEALRQIIRAVVAEALAALEADRVKLEPDRLAYGEAEAARLLGLAWHQLRDARRLGRIGYSIGPGRRILYTPADLATYLAARRTEASAAADEPVAVEGRLNAAAERNGISRRKRRIPRD